MNELKDWLEKQIKWSDKKRKEYDKNSELYKAYYYQSATYEVVLNYIVRILDPTFCATCGKQTNGEQFCSQECSEYETLE